MAKLLIPIIIFHVGLVPIAVAAAAATAPAAAAPPAAVADDDRSALLAFLSNVSADPGGALADWGRSPEFCNWTGVTCGGGGHGRRRRVTQLVLSSKGLSGVISPALGRLSFLTVLDLSSNAFAGAIPPELGALSMLTQLSLTNNLLDGAIPAGIGFLQRLYYLDLSGNRLAGGIPATLFCNCSALQYLDLANNSLAGDIPYSGECRLPSLRFLLLWSNGLSGEIPAALANSPILEWVDFESNYLSGELPSEVFDKLPRLQFLYLSYNNLSSHGGNTDLGPFFRSLSNCTRLQELELAGNDLGGDLAAASAAAGELPRGLRQLHLEDNAISGSIPPNISVLVNLTYLNLSNNLLNGSIPPELSGMRRLERLYLSNNLLSGEIPNTLGEIPHLGLVDLSGNRLSGSIPDTFSNLTQLRRLMLHHNALSGAIPPSLGDCPNLEILDLSHNALEGPIPARVVAALSSLKLYLNLSSNHLEGALPMELSKMDMILALDLSANALAGPIPPQLAGCVALEYLNLSGNALRGALPGPLASLPFLRVLDVSRNALSGPLPGAQLQVSTSLRVADFSYNNFSGVVPLAGALENLSPEAFRGNPGLCSYDAPGGIIPACEPTKRARRSRRPLVVPAVAGIVAAVSLMLAAVGCRGMAARRPMRRRFVDVEEEVEREHPRVSYRELAEATGGFVQEGLIGAGRFGRVYEGTLRGGARVAVKVLDAKGGAAGEVSGSFKRECEVLRRTRHKNLVRVITTCSTAGFNALVLPLMPNGSLDGLLYPPHGGGGNGGGGGLDFAQIMGVASDVAEGMAYLHHYAPVRVVHCDLKPSNVLLDEGMRAVISDFGIARLVAGAGDESAPCNSITGLLQGSVGYIAPEYGLGGHPSTQGDVYSFGVMLLELITGKRPTDVIFHEGLTLHDWVRRHYPHDVAAVLAHAPWRERPLPQSPAAAEVAVVELIELGLVCTQHSPALRPTMADVCHELTLLREDLARCGGAADGGDGSFSTKDSLFSN
ncbi:unnamed protein product [Urochloa humidicola]